MGKDVYKIVTDRIMELLQQNQVPWRKPWAGGGAPMNLESKRAYSGINVFLLLSRGFSSRYWMTYKQAQRLGGQVRKGEKSTMVVFWKVIEKDEDEDKEEEEKEKIPLLRYYNVFNAEQVDGIEEKLPKEVEQEKEMDVIEEAEQVISGMPFPPAFSSGSRACYLPGRDEIMLPPFQNFVSPETYYSTAFHELTHSTGHETRLNRLDRAHWREKEEYSKEELIAEMGASFLNAQVGIMEEVEENSAAYIQGWLRALENDKKLVVSAASKAQKAVEYIMGEAE